MQNQELCNNANMIKSILIIGVIFIHSFSTVPAEPISTLMHIKVFFSFVLPRIAVPVFFMYSGFFYFKGEPFMLKTYIKKIKRRFFTLVIPYFLWCMITAFAIIWQTSYCNMNFIEIIDKLFWGSSVSGTTGQYILYEMPKVAPIDGPLWFVRDLFIICLITPVLYKIIKNVVGGVFCISIMLLAFVFTDTDKYPYIGIDNVSFFMIGAFLSIHEIPIYLKKSLIRFILLCCFFFSLYLSYHLYQSQYSVYTRHLYIVSAILMIIVLPSIKSKYQKFLEPGLIFFIFCAHIIVIDYLTIITYRLSFVLSELFNTILYMMQPLLCAVICMYIYKMMQNKLPCILNYLIGNRTCTIKK